MAGVCYLLVSRTHLVRAIPTEIHKSSAMMMHIAVSKMLKSRLLFLVMVGTCIVIILASLHLRKAQSPHFVDHSIKLSLNLSSALSGQLKRIGNLSLRSQPAFNSTILPTLTSRQNEHGHNSIFLLKTHKTGGTAIQNIILRQAVLRNLTVGLSSARNDWSRLCMDKIFTKRCLCNRRQLPVDIIAHHMVFNKAQVKASMKAGARYISIVREPVDVIVSSYTYFSWNSRFKTFDNFLNSTIDSKELCSGAILLPYRNVMMYVFGLRTWEFDNEALVDRQLAEIMSTFDLIMINDNIRFNQSLILLKEMMGWTFDDVAVFSLNKQGPSTSKPDVSESQKKLILQANHADLLLYKASLAVFEEKVAKFGADKMNEQVVLLVERTEMLRRLCVSGAGHLKDIISLMLTHQGQTTPICRYMVSREKELTSLLINRHNSLGYKNKCHDSNS